MWYSAMVPHCFWNESVTWRKWDWAWVSSRSAAQRWLIELPQHFFGCSLAQDPGYRGRLFLGGHLFFGSPQNDASRFNVSRDDFQGEDVLLGVRTAGPFSDTDYTLPVMVVHAKDNENTQKRLCASLGNPAHPHHLQVAGVQADRCRELGPNNICGPGSLDL